MRNISTKVLPLLLMALPLSAAPSRINPFNQIDWTKVTGATAPTVTCQATIYGMPYTNTATGDFYVCAVSGWVLITGGGGSSVQVNGSTVASPNFNGTTPAAGTNGKNITYQVSGSSISGQIVGDGNASHFLNGMSTYTTPAGGGNVSGTGVNGFLACWTSSTDLATCFADYGVTLASVFTFSKPVAVATGSGVGGTVDFTEGTAATGASGHDVLYADSSAHCVKQSLNGGSFACLGTGSTTPSGSNGVIQIANTAGTALDSDSTIAIDNATHKLNVGTLGANFVTIGALGTATTWTFDTTSKATAALSVGSGTPAASKYIDGATGAWTSLPSPGTGTVTSVATSTGLSGGTITTTGTLSCATASSSVVGCVKVDGTTITAAAGVISAVGGATSGWTNITGSGQITASGCTQSASTGGVCTASAASTVTLSVIPGTHTHLHLKINGTSASVAQVRCQFNGDTGASYASEGIVLQNTSLSGSATTDSTHYLFCGLVGSLFGQSTADILNYTSTAVKKGVHTLGAAFSATNAATNNFSIEQNGVWNSTAAVTSITIIPDSGTLTGLITLEAED